MTDSERHQLLFGWNQTDQQYPREVSVQALFEAQVDRSPDTTAVEFGDQSLTYRELNDRANQLAYTLRAKGVGPNTPVGIDTGRSIEFVIAVLGILKAGGAYLPLDPEYPAERLQLMMADSKAPLLVRAVQGPDSATFPDCQVVEIDPWTAGSKKSAVKNPPIETTLDNLAYVIYTSGSTGRPKGVSMPHRPLVNLIQWQNSTSSVGLGDRTLQFAPLGFDVCFQEILATLSTGGTLVVLCRQARRDFAGLLRIIELQSIRRIFLPFIALEYLADEAIRTRCIPTSLREVITAGEQLRVTPTIRSFFAQLKDARLINQYGPAEAHVVTWFELSGDPANWPFWPPIGRPVSNTQIYILDSEKNPVPAGTSGELYIGGVQVSQGYLHRPELTAEKFVDDPFIPGLGRRLYRTGDAARWLPDGNLEYQGRVDDQVKIRGYRVELGEVEAYLSTHPQVKECVVMAKEARTGEKSLVAYLVLRPQASAGSEVLRQFMKQKLPDHMVPSHFMILSAFPVNPNGKVDRKALPQPDPETQKMSEYMAPQTDFEIALTKIWEEAFERQRIGIRDDFFDLGGQSLLAARVIGRINREFQANLEITQLLGNPTIESLSAILASGKRQSNEPLVVTLQAGDVAPPVYFVWRNAHWDRLRFKTSESQRPPFYITEAPYSSDVLLTSARRDYNALPTVQELAAPHTKLILDSLTSDSCIVAGYSYGVALAFEVAQQLEGAGISVEAVLLFDGNMKPVGWERVKQKSRYHARQLASIGWSYPLKWLNSHRAKGNAAAESGNAVNEALLPSREKLDLASWAERWPLIDRIWIKALERYEPRPFDGRGVLIRAEGDVSTYSKDQDYDQCLGWKRFFRQGIQVIKVPGDHLTIWDAPQVQELRQALETSLLSLHKTDNREFRAIRSARRVAATAHQHLFSTFLCWSKFLFCDLMV